MLHFRLNRGRDGLSSVQIAFAIAMSIAQNPIDILVYMMSPLTFKKIGKSAQHFFVC